MHWWRHGTGVRLRVRSWQRDTKPPIEKKKYEYPTSLARTRGYRTILDADREDWDREGACLLGCVCVCELQYSSFVPTPSAPRSCPLYHLPPPLPQSESAQAPSCQAPTWTTVLVVSEAAVPPCSCVLQQEVSTHLARLTCIQLRCNPCVCVIACCEPRGSPGSHGARGAYLPRLERLRQRCGHHVATVPAERGLLLSPPRLPVHVVRHSRYRPGAHCPCPLPCHRRVPTRSEPQQRRRQCAWWGGRRVGSVNPGGRPARCRRTSTGNPVIVCLLPGVNAVCPSTPHHHLFHACTLSSGSSRLFSSCRLCPHPSSSLPSSFWFPCGDCTRVHPVLACSPHPPFVVVS